MNTKNPTRYIVFGARIRYLIGCNPGQSIFQKSHIFDNLNSLVDDLTSLDLVVSKNLFHMLFDDTLEKFENMKNSEPNATLNANDYELFNNSLRQLETTIFAEANNQTIIFPSKRKFNIDLLLKCPEQLFRTSVYDSLTETAKIDIQNSFKCITVEAATASAFHILRAVEECVRVLYKAYFPRGDKSKPWGQLTTQLKQKNRKPVPDHILMLHLDHLRTKFRNPTDHPDKNYDTEEAEDLISIASDIINRCMLDPQVRKRVLKLERNNES
ncbi:hypothetical protein [Aeromonas veronii]|uniref:hypothetical protein n=1 Tax=Aeromonas veronii TaxID=654 RepID=UPI003D1B4DCF